MKSVCTCMHCSSLNTYHEVEQQTIYNLQYTTKKVHSFRIMYMNNLNMQLHVHSRLQPKLKMGSEMTKNCNSRFDGYKQFYLQIEYMNSLSVVCSGK